MTTKLTDGPMITPDMTDEIAALDLLEYSHPAPEIISNFLKEALLAGVHSSFKPYGAACNPIYHAVHFSGRRPLSVIRLHIIHSTESSDPSALGVARYFTEQKAGGSTTYVNDDFECYRTLRDDQIPWGAPGVNYCGLHYEQQGKAGWLTFMWSKKHRRTITRTAWKVARDCKKYGNSPRWLGEAALRRERDNALAGRASKGGISDHATATRAFGGSHWDPGPNYPRKLFMTLVRASYVVIKVRRIA